MSKKEKYLDTFAGCFLPSDIGAISAEEKHSMHNNLYRTSSAFETVSWYGFYFFWFTGTCGKGRVA